ncbi:MAG TPA: hypothetical protein VJS64_16715, partial [Pyrinomonadaceae bacterium]|nr:hypothetical protein [Pyrinomonadaceae bacterium]
CQLMTLVNRESEIARRIVIVDFRWPIDLFPFPVSTRQRRLIGNPQLAIAFGLAHPLPRSSTDLIGTAQWMYGNGQAASLPAKKNLLT